MLTLIFLLPILLIAFAVSRVLRLVFGLSRFRRNRRYGYNPYRYGARRHHHLLGGILPILALVALDRFTGGRRF